MVKTRGHEYGKLTFEVGFETMDWGPYFWAEGVKKKCLRRTFPTIFSTATLTKRGTVAELPSKDVAIDLGLKKDTPNLIVDHLFFHRNFGVSPVFRPICLYFDGNAVTFLPIVDTPHRWPQLMEWLNHQNPKIGENRTVNIL